MDCLSTYCTHAQTCDDVRVHSALKIRYWKKPNRCIEEFKFNIIETGLAQRLSFTFSAQLWCHVSSCGPRWNISHVAIVLGFSSLESRAGTCIDKVGSVPWIFKFVFQQPQKVSMVIVCVRAKCAQSTQLHDVLGLETIRNGCLRQFLQACFVGRQRTETLARIASIICDGYAYQMNTPHTLYSQPGQRDRPCHSLFSLFIKNKGYVARLIATRLFALLQRENIKRCMGSPGDKQSDKTWSYVSWSALM